MVFTEYDPICLLTLTFSIGQSWLWCWQIWHGLNILPPVINSRRRRNFRTSVQWNLTEAFRLVCRGHQGVSLTITKITPLRSHPLPINWHPVIHTPIHHVSSPSGNNKKNNIFKKYPNNSLKTTNSLRSSFRLTLGQLWEFGKYWWLWIWLDLSGRG